MDGIFTHVYFKHLANLQPGLGHSPGTNERVYVVIHRDGVECGIRQSSCIILKHCVGRSVIYVSLVVLY
jgi:hypothetical protein